MSLDPEHEAMKRETEREQTEERRKDREYEKTLKKTTPCDYCSTRPATHSTNDGNVFLCDECDSPTLEDYRKQITRNECDGHCKFKGLKSRPIKHYNHSGGWPVQGFQVLQWLYVTCPKCGYQWALWKLGVPR